MKKICAIFTLVFLLTCLMAVPVAALEIDVEDTYSTGEVVLIKVTDDQAITPADCKVELIKPNGDSVDIQLRKSGWTDDNECYESYTIEMIGDHKLNVTNAAGETASVEFVSKVFTRSSIIFMIISIVIFVGSCLAYVSLRKSHRKGA